MYRNVAWYPCNSRTCGRKFKPDSLKVHKRGCCSIRRARAFNTSPHILQPQASPRLSLPEIMVWRKKCKTAKSHLIVFNCNRNGFSPQPSFCTWHWSRVTTRVAAKSEEVMAGTDFCTPCWASRISSQSNNFQLDSEKLLYICIVVLCSYKRT